MGSKNLWQVGRRGGVVMAQTFEEWLKSVEHVDFGFLLYKFKAAWENGAASRDAEIAALRGRMEVLEKLRFYTKHWQDCAQDTESERKIACSCGLTQLRAALDAPIETSKPAVLITGGRREPANENAGPAGKPAGKGDSK
jgi:hypothetical protein